MTTTLQEAESNLLAPTGIAQNDVEAMLAELYTHDIDYGDLYFQHHQSESWSLEDGIVKDAGFNIERGVGVRAVSGEKSSLAYADEITLPSLKENVGIARTIAKAGQARTVGPFKKMTEAGLYLPQSPFPSMNEKAKIALLEAIDARARAADPRIVEVMASIVGAYDVVLVAATDGTYAADVRPLVRLNVMVVADSDGKREKGYCAGGARTDFGYFTDEELRWEYYTDEAVRIALTNLEAVDTPAGQMDVVLGSGWPGILLHEAIGHGLEGDFNRKGTSSFSDLMGQQIASSNCTVVDQGNMPGRRGSLNIDDEGTPTQETVLIENGILKSYMQDKLNARLMGVPVTGNGRRESYACLPMPRMTNTYMKPGEHHVDEMIAKVKHGLYAVNFGGGQVDITSGKFVFVVNEAYLIEDGKLGAPVKGATLIGDGPSALKTITMVGNDFALDTGVGVCGKDGQSVPVGVGQPSLLMEDMTVGGTE